MTTRSKGFLLGCAAAFFLITSPISTFSGEPAQNDSQKLFEASMMKSVEKLKAIEKNRTYKLRAINDSIRKTLEAVNSLIERQDFKQAEQLLIEANRASSDNVIAELLLADVYDNKGKTSAANKAYLRFLSKGAKASQFSQDAMDFETRMVFANYVREKLLRRGIRPPKPRGMERLPLASEFAFGAASPLRSLIAVGLPLMTIFGIPLLIFRELRNYQNPAPSAWNQLIPKIYLVVAAAYLLWSLHLFLDISPFIEPIEHEIILFLAVGFITVSAIQWFAWREKEKRKLDDPTLMPCPHCKKIIQKLASACPFCETKL